MHSTKIWTSTFGIGVFLDVETLNKFERFINECNNSGVRFFGEKVSKTSVINAIAWHASQMSATELADGILRNCVSDVHAKALEGVEKRKIRVDGIEQTHTEMKKQLKVVKPFVKDMLERAGLDTCGFHWTNSWLIATVIHWLLNRLPERTRIEEMRRWVREMESYFDGSQDPVFTVQPKRSSEDSQKGNRRIAN